MEKKENKTLIYAGWFLKRLIMIIFDLAVGYLAYFMALVIRFYINGSFSPSINPYLGTFYNSAPFYCVGVVIIFAICGLYTNRWKYAGIHDFNILCFVNIITSLYQLILTAVIFGHMMPKSYYAIGFVLQLFATICIRFSYIFYVGIATVVFKNKKATFRIMIVGAGKTARYVREMYELSREENAIVKFYFVKDNHKIALSQNGVPVYTNIDKLEEHLTKNRINLICLTDPCFDEEYKQRIIELSKKLHIDVRNYVDTLFNNNDLTINSLIEKVSGPCCITLDDVTKEYSDPKDAIIDINKRYLITSIAVENNKLNIHAVTKMVKKNDLSAEWVKETEEKTGEAVSFF